MTPRNLTRDGLVARRVGPPVPPQVHHRLTGLGLSPQAALAVVRAWTEEHMAEADRANGLSGRDEAPGPR
ncbi:winged helix-turn-helix transcriptional regulator [Streptomyces sp. NPDC004690]